MLKWNCVTEMSKLGWDISKDFFNFYKRRLKYMNWNKRVSGFYEEEHLLRDSENSLVIHILKERGADDFIGRVYSPYDDNNIFKGITI